MILIPWNDVNSISEAHGLDPKLIGAIIATESGGNRYAFRYEPHYKWIHKPNEFAKANGITAISETITQMTSWGLCQVMGAVARENGLTGPIFQLLQSDINILYACKLLRRLSRLYTSKTDVISAYNAGTPIKNINGTYKNQDYVDKVLGFIHKIENNEL